jgi:REP element-mobilizing transposase RayT
VHVTLRICDSLPSLRSKSFVKELRRSFAAACERGTSRLVHFSIQRDHLHLLLEADDERALGRAMKCISARVARAVNRIFRRRGGGVLLGRYHVRALRTPREVRNAIAYVLFNARKHFAQRYGHAPPVRLDEASSGRWFDGWSHRLQPLSSHEPPPVAPPRTWLLRVGWRRHGAIRLWEVPGAT